MKFFEDIRVGETVEIGSHVFTAEDIKTFAQRFDPQPFHVDDEAAARPGRRRGRRGGRSRGRRSVAAGTLEGTFDHGEEGYGLWLDPAIADNPVYAEHWAGHRPVEVTVEEDQIVIRRAGGGEDDDDE